MKTTLNHTGVLAALLAIFITEPLLGSPPRSPYGGVPHPTYSSQRQRQQQTNSYRYQRYRHQPSVQSRRTCSYAPSPQVEFAAGDRAIVTGDNAALMVASDVLGNIAKGTEFTLTKVQGQWLGVSAEIEGRQISGWILAGEVAQADAHLQPHGMSASPVEDAGRPPEASVQGSSGLRHRGRCNAGTHRSAGWSSNSSRIPENLSTYQWGWWDLKDRW